MLGKAIGHLRHNAVAYLALFVALTGTAFAVGLPRNSVSSRNIVNGEVKRPDIHRNAVTARHVKDVRRSIQIPIASFVDCETAGGAPLDFTEAADAIPNLFMYNNTHLAIRFDAVTGQKDEGSIVCSQFVVPPDAVSPLGVLVRAAKQQDLGAGTETINANINGRSEDADMEAGTDEHTYQFPMPDIGFDPDDSQSLALQLRSQDDHVQIRGVEFVYRAKQ